VKNEHTFVLGVTYYVFYDFMCVSFSLQVLQCVNVQKISPLLSFQKHLSCLCVCVCVCVCVCGRTLVVFNPLKFMLRRDQIKKVQSPLVETMSRSTGSH